MGIKSFAPNLHVKSIYNIDLKALKDTGVTTIITDLDNTLVEADSPLHTPELIKWLDDLQEIGFKVIIVSNNNKTRVSDFAKPLTVPYIHSAMKPIKKSFNKALQILDSTKDETVVIGDQLLTDVLGGNRSGMYTILVTPISEREKITTKINRTLEKKLMSYMKKHGLMTWEDYND